MKEASLKKHRDRTTSWSNLALLGTEKHKRRKHIPTMLPTFFRNTLSKKLSSKADTLDYFKRVVFVSWFPSHSHVRYNGGNLHSSLNKKASAHNGKNLLSTTVIVTTTMPLTTTCTITAPRATRFAMAATLPLCIDLLPKNERKKETGPLKPPKGRWFQHETIWMCHVLRQQSFRTEQQA